MITCDVILAVWNGQIYLPAMLDSLLSQTTSDFNVLVRDALDRRLPGNS